MLSSEPTAAYESPRATYLPNAGAAFADPVSATVATVAVAIAATVGSRGRHRGIGDSSVSRMSRRVAISLLAGNDALIGELLSIQRKSVKVDHERAALIHSATGRSRLMHSADRRMVHRSACTTSVTISSGAAFSSAIAMWVRAASVWHCTCASRVRTAV